jgi:diacylglycerol kinase family enzyme
MRKAIVIFNPRAGRQSDARDKQLVAALAGQAIEATLAWTQYAGHATELARQATAEQGVDLVITVGGDGTIREAASGMKGSNARLLPLAGGTANVIARGLGTAGSHLKVISGFAGLQSRNLDVGDCAGQPFLMQASAGVDAFVMREVNPYLKRHLGVVGVGLSGIACSLRYPFPCIRVSVDGVGHECTGIIVASFPFYAGLFHLGAQVVPDDGRMNVILFSGEGFGAASGFSLDLALGRHLQRRDVRALVAGEVIIEGPAEVPVQVDGDVFIGAKPIRVRMSGWQIEVLSALTAPAFRSA